MIALIEVSNDLSVTVAAKKTLSQIGDPRFTGKEPVVIPISLQSSQIISFSQHWGKIHASWKWTNTQKMRAMLLMPLISIYYSLFMLTHFLDYWLFTRFHPLRQQFLHKRPFAMGKYLVTNIEYARFVEATSHQAPKYWLKNTFPAEEATYPVVGITVRDAKAYCRWLSITTGKSYRLPTEWEWELAVTNPHGADYPWGDQFDPSKCNTREANLNVATPVGTYPTGISRDGLTDMIGNVWEITQSHFTFPSLFGSIAIVVISFVLFFSYPVIIYNSTISFLLSSFFTSILPLLYALIFLYFWYRLTYMPSILKRGAFDTNSIKAACFSRGIFPGFQDGETIGFRCLQEL